MPRLNYGQISADIFAGMRHSKQALANSPLGLPLLELVYLRISQINGCAFCLEMHSKALRARHESQQRLDALAGWRVSALFSPAEQAALNWAESLTHIDQSHAPDEDYARLLAHFTEQQISDLTLAIAHMNALNRVAIAMRQ